MIRPSGLKRAPNRGALFAFGLLALWLLLPTARAADCLSFAPDEWALVKHVHDGDTLKLKDGRKLRLIGINTPELGRDGRPAEPLAKAARDYLRQILPVGSRVALRFGQDKKDKYGRFLAHVYSADRRNAQVALLEKGLAAAIAVTPNVANLECYLAAEATAAGQGIWQQKRFSGIESRDLNKRARGFHVVQGRVQRVGESRKAIWLNFDGGLAARIDKRDLHYFSVDPKQWQGRRLRLRGWLYQTKGQLQMNLQHSALVQLLD